MIISYNSRRHKDAPFYVGHHDLLLYIFFLTKNANFTILALAGEGTP